MVNIGKYIIKKSNTTRFPQSFSKATKIFHRCHKGSTSVVYGNLFLLHNTESFAKVENLSKLTFTLFKFVVAV
jgi:hypothetical protein